MADELLIITEGYSEDSTVEEDLLIVTEGYAENIPTVTEVEDELQDINDAIDDINTTLSNLIGTVSGGFTNLFTSNDELKRLILRLEDKFKLEDNKLRDIIGIIMEENKKTRTQFSDQINRIERQIPKGRQF